MSDGLEIHSILEFGDEPVQGLWWVLSPSGESPPIRAGAASLIIANEERPELDERILITGGATPDGFIDNCVELNLFTGAWKPLVSTDFVARYEHAMIAAEDNKTPTVLLGSSNSESLQAQRLTVSGWEKVDFTGPGISSRTVAQPCSSNKKLFIWSGGTQAGPSPDPSVYVVSGSSVEKHKISGEVPSVAQEYAACANDDFMFVHGGLTATGKSNSLYRINLKTFRSKCCSIANDPIGKLAMHKMVLVSNRIFLFGGLNDENVVSDELWELSPTNEHWTQFTARKCIFETKPTPRLAFNFHVLNLPIAPKSSNSIEAPPPPSGAPNIQPIDDWKVTIDGENIKAETSDTKIDISDYSQIPVLFIHGGCDAEGEFFNDLYVAAIPPAQN